jgi:hypothetical protein
VKIRLVATPVENVLVSALAEVVRELEAAGLVPRATRQQVETDLAGEAASPSETEARAAIARLNQTFAAWPQRAVSVRMETVLDQPAAPAESSAFAVSTSTAELAKLRDLNGSGANAALPKVLAAAGRAAVSSALAPKLTEATGVAQLADRVGVAPLVLTEAANRFVALDPYRGALIALAESLRDQACAGARALVLADRYRLASASSPDELARLAESVRGFAEAAAFFDVPVGATELAANGAPSSVALIAAGRSENASGLVPRFVRAAAQKLVLLGEAPHEIGGSCYLAAVHEMTAGAVPSVDFAAEKKLQDALLTLGRARAISAARSVSAGGLLATVCGLLFAPVQTSGARLDLTSLGGARADALLFGESQGRAIVAAPPERVGTVLAEAHMRGVPAARIGEVVADPVLELKTRSLATDWRIDALRGDSAAAVK